MSRPTIQLAPERHAQIKAIGAALGHKTISETIAHMINSEITKGTIPAGIEGVTIKSAGDGVTIAFDDQPPVLFSLDGAQVLASTLCEFADADADKRAELQFNVGHNFKAERKGNGVKLTIPLHGDITKSFPRDVARDLANSLANAA